MQIARFNAALVAEWDAVVASSRNGNFLHSRAYMDYHAHRFTDHSLLVYAGDKPVAVFPANQVEDRVVTHGGLTYGGLIYGTGLHANDVLEIFDAIGAYYRQAGIISIDYKAIPHVFHRYPAEEDLYALFRHDAQLFRRDLSSVIDLSTRPKFSDSRKNTARKAEKLGAEVRVLGDLSKFHALLTEVLSKFGATPVHSIAELNLLRDRFRERIVVHGAMLGAELLAGLLVFDFDHIVHVQYMASSASGRRHGALDYLLFQLIDVIYKDRKYLSFGISTEQQGRFLNEGLVRQKEGFGGRAVVHDFYNWKLQ